MFSIINSIYYINLNYLPTQIILCFGWLFGLSIKCYSSDTFTIKQVLEQIEGRTTGSGPKFPKHVYIFCNTSTWLIYIILGLPICLVLCTKYYLCHFQNCSHQCEGHARTLKLVYINACSSWPWWSLQCCLSVSNG